MKVEESLNVTFDESPPPTKLSPLVDDDVGEEEAIRMNTKIVNTKTKYDESIEVDEIVNIKESKNHPIDQAIGNLNQRTLRSQAQNYSNFFCFISTIKPKNVNEALKDESWVVAMQEELNQFVTSDVWELFSLPMSQSVIGKKWVFKNKLDEDGIVSRNKARLVSQGYNQQEGLQIKQIEDGIFFNQSKYVKEMLKKFRLEDSKPTKTPMSTEIKLTKDDEAGSVDSSKYLGDYVDRKSTSSICTFMGCFLTSWTLESRYVYEGRTIDPSFYNDLNDDSVAKFTAIGFDCLLSLDEKIFPRRTVHEKIDKEGNTIHKLPNQIETNELFDHLRPCELVIRKNVYSAIGNRDHTQAGIALMLYCLENEQPFNLAYFIIMRMHFFRDRRDRVLPYGMILTRLFKNIKANMPQIYLMNITNLSLEKCPYLGQNNPRGLHLKELGM
nr:hypothetical protein CTI12_AA182560 [Tanacetum cinerariifolium]